MTMFGTSMRSSPIERAVAAFFFVLLISPSGPGFVSPALGETTGDTQRGFELALKVCEECHIVATGKKQPKSAVTGAPSFFKLAKDPEVTPFYLKSFFRTPHQKMPDFILKPGEQDDLIAYIMSLRPMGK